MEELAELVVTSPPEEKEEASPRSMLLEGVREEWRTKSLSDVTIVCAGGQTVMSHRLVLAALSPALLGRALLSVTPEADGEGVILVPDVSPGELGSFLGAVYLGGGDEARVPQTLDFLGFSPLGGDLALMEAGGSATCSKEEQQSEPEEMSAVPRGKRQSVTRKGKRSAPAPKYIAVASAFDKKTSTKKTYRCRQCKKVVKVPQAVPCYLGLFRHLLETPNHEEVFEETLAACCVSREEVLGEIEKTKKLVGGDDGDDDAAEEEDAAKRTCPDCGRVYSRRKAMEVHRDAVHSGRRPYVCSECGASFARKESFKRHSHEAVKPFLCSACGKTFARRHIRDIHERAHRGDKRYPCSYCEKRFVTNQKRRIHERIHTGEKPFQCSVCSKKFVQKHQLQTHSRIHTGARPYRCDFCGQMFRHLSTKTKHNCPARQLSTTPPLRAQSSANAVAC